MIKVKNNDVIWLTFTFIAFAAVFVTLLTYRPAEYNFIWLLPLLFFIMSAICKDIYKKVPSNLAVSIILALLFCRVVVSPLLKSLVNDFSGDIFLNAKINTSKAILLIGYETIAIFVFLYFKVNSDKSKADVVGKNPRNTKLGVKRYVRLVLVVLAALIVCIIIAPELLNMYRTVFDINDSKFTHYEDAYIIENTGKRL